MAFMVSFKNFFERQAVDALRADAPMDAGTVWTLIDNVGHMIDECGKYRVNWFGTLYADGEHYAVSMTTARVLPIWFPTQVIQTTQYPRYDVRVAINADDIYPIRVSLVTPNTQAPITGLDAGVIGTFTGDSVVGTTWLEGLIVERSTQDAPLDMSKAPADGSVAVSIGYHAMVKLLIEGLEPGASVVGVQVREFLR